MYHVSNNQSQTHCNKHLTGAVSSPINHTHYVMVHHLNPLTCMSDQHGISPYNINTTPSKKVMRTTQNIN